MKKKDEIVAELKALAVDFGENGAHETVFHTPKNFFEHFPDQMTAIIKAMNADTSFASAPAATEPYVVPDGYFDHFCGDLMSRIEAAEHIVVHGRYAWNDRGKPTPYHIPDNYFSEFEERLFHKIFREETVAAEELDSLSPLLAGLKKEQPFALPKSYFNSEDFARQVQQQEEESRVVEHPAVRSIKWARWAAAAAVIAIFMVGAFQFLVPVSTQKTSPAFEQALARIPDERIKDWLSNNMDESDVNSLGGHIANIKEIRATSSLDNLSEQEIKDYLESEVW